MTNTDPSGLEALDRAECMRLLGRQSFGRAGLTVAALPTVLPVPYRLMDGAIFFRTTRHPKLMAATSEAVIAFEIDHLNSGSLGGWSVVAVGRAHNVSPDDDAIRRADEAGLAQWTPTGPALVVRMAIDLVSGRRLTPRGA